MPFARQAGHAATAEPGADVSGTGAAVGQGTAGSSARPRYSRRASRWRLPRSRATRPATRWRRSAISSGGRVTPSGRFRSGSAPWRCAGSSPTGAGSLAASSAWRWGWPPATSSSPRRGYSAPPRRSTTSSGSGCATTWRPITRISSRWRARTWVRPSPGHWMAGQASTVDEAVTRALEATIGGSADQSTQDAESARVTAARSGGVFSGQE